MGIPSSEPITDKEFLTAEWERKNRGWPGAMTTAAAGMDE
jgi:hypothetical protein